MARYLKRGLDPSAIKAADAKVRETVEQILADIEARKDVAVRELSQKFDNWSPQSFKLTAAEIERAIGQVRKRDLDDLKFAQAQVRNFAQKQRETMRDLELCAIRRRRGLVPPPHSNKLGVFCVCKRWQKTANRVMAEAKNCKTNN